MRHPRNAPIGRRFTAILQIIARSRISTVGIAAQMFSPADDPRPRPARWRVECPPGSPWYPSAAAIAQTEAWLGMMVSLGYVQAVSACQPGHVWDLAVRGCGVVALMARSVERRRFKTSKLRRIKTKFRRDVLSRRSQGRRTRCINENQSGTHGPPVRDSCRCRPCTEQHRRSA